MNGKLIRNVRSCVVSDTSNKIKMSQMKEIREYFAQRTEKKITEIGTLNDAMTYKPRTKTIFFRFPIC